MLRPRDPQIEQMLALLPDDVSKRHALKVMAEGFCSVQLRTCLHYLEDLGLSPRQGVVVLTRLLQQLEVAATAASEGAGQ